MFMVQFLSVMYHFCQEIIRSIKIKKLIKYTELKFFSFFRIFAMLGLSY